MSRKRRTGRSGAALCCAFSLVEYAKGLLRALALLDGGCSDFRANRSCGLRGQRQVLLHRWQHGRRQFLERDHPPALGFLLEELSRFTVLLYHLRHVVLIKG